MSLTQLCLSIRKLGPFRLKRVTATAPHTQHGAILDLLIFPTPRPPFIFRSKANSSRFTFVMGQKQVASDSPKLDLRSKASSMKRRAAQIQGRERRNSGSG